MKVKTNEVLNVKYTARNTPKSIILVLFTLLFIMLPLSVMRDSSEKSPKIISLVSGLKNSTEVKKCNIFCGKWIHYPEGPYYDNKSCHWIIDQQNCMKFGRTDSEFLHWRWKPDECELPLFDATQFLNVVKGKKMVFVGDSVGRNQMQSLLCLLSHVSEPEDISLKYTTDETYFRRFYYTEYNFTLANLWSPYFVKSSEDNMNDHSYDSIMKLYLDEADKAWTSQVEDFDIVIISAGHWFFRPLLFYENKQLVGCNKCGKENVTELGHYYGYKKAFRTAFRTLINLRRFKGVTYFRTFSPSHFENGDWNKGGNCIRTKPFSNEEMKLDGYVLETYLTQVKEFKAAQKVATKKGLKFNMLDTTEIMLLRPDGHPNNFGHAKDKNVTFNDCVHWCLPGPIDTWNEFLFYMLKLGQKSGSKVQRIF